MIINIITHDHFTCQFWPGIKEQHSEYKFWLTFEKKASLRHLIQIIKSTETNRILKPTKIFQQLNLSKHIISKNNKIISQTEQMCLLDLFLQLFNTKVLLFLPRHLLS